MDEIKKLHKDFMADQKRVRDADQALEDSKDTRRALKGHLGSCGSKGNMSHLEEKVNSLDVVKLNEAVSVHWFIISQYIHVCSFFYISTVMEPGIVLFFPHCRHRSVEVQDIGNAPSLSAGVLCAPTSGEQSSAGVRRVMAALCWASTPRRRQMRRRTQSATWWMN